MSERFKIAFSIQKDMQDELRRSVIDSGYGLRGKSKWISEAIADLLDMANFPELVEYSSEMSNFDKMDTITVDDKTKAKIDKAIKEVRVEYPVLEGVQSCIIRTSIMQRLLRN